VDEYGRNAGHCEAADCLLRADSGLLMSDRSTRAKRSAPRSGIRNTALNERPTYRVEHSRVNHSSNGIRASRQLPASGEMVELMSMASMVEWSGHTKTQSIRTRSSAHPPHLQAGESLGSVFAKYGIL
jgi:hypothetical protein